MALDRLAPRYALWLHMGEVGIDPEHLSRAGAVRFCRLHLTGFLAEQGLSLSARRRRRLERVIAAFDPRYRTPYEHMARLGIPPSPRA